MLTAGHTDPAATAAAASGGIAGGITAGASTIGRKAIAAKPSPSPAGNKNGELKIMPQVGQPTRLKKIW
ncbi:Uncharacterised protein [Mycobacterium tuberculosis]|nr:Uncharacterised protein [Mycobacterium tuberculosis]